MSMTALPTARLGLEDVTSCVPKMKALPHLFLTFLPTVVFPMQVAPMKEILTTALSNGRAQLSPVSCASAR